MKTISFETAEKLTAVARKFCVDLPQSEKVWYPKLGEMILLTAHHQKLKELGTKAYNTNELLQWLPRMYFLLPKGDGGFRVASNSKCDLDFIFEDRTPQETLASLAIYLIKNGHLK